MSKQDLAEILANKTGSSKREAEESLNVILDEITKTLSKGEDIVFTGFGKFSVSHREAREARNPKTGEAIHVPAMKVPKFKAGKSLKEAVR